jgi:hypothetical protein
MSPEAVIRAYVETIFNQRQVDRAGELVAEGDKVAVRRDGRPTHLPYPSHGAQKLGDLADAVL